MQLALAKLKMKKTIAVLLLGLFCANLAQAQLDKKSKRILKRASKLYDKGKYYKSSDKIEKVFQLYPVNEGLWKFYQEVHFANYRTNYKPDKRISVRSDMESEEDRRRAEALEKQINYIYELPLYEYLNAVSYASLCVPFNARSSIMLRKQYIDRRYYSDTGVSRSSMKLLVEAEKQFTNKNFEKALSLYSDALEVDSSNYKAFLYLGDTYYNLKYYGKAAELYRQAIAKQPNLIEAKKYLIDALANKGEYDKALNQAINCLYTYPEESIFLKIGELAKRKGLKLDRNWVLKLTHPNNITNDLRRRPIFEEKLHWTYYEQALSSIGQYYSVEGLLKVDAPEHLSNYLEVESWKQMLDKTKGQSIPALNYARIMQENDLLEPYLLVNLFHPDFYEQYLHFIKSEDGKLNTYLQDFLLINPS